MGNIIFGVLIIGLGIFNLIIWKMIKTDSNVIKATLVDRFYVRRGHIYGQKGVVIQYTVDDREYITKIIVSKNSPLYDGITRK